MHFLTVGWNRGRLQADARPRSCFDTESARVFVWSLERGDRTHARAFKKTARTDPNRRSHHRHDSPNARQHRAGWYRSTSGSPRHTRRVTAASRRDVPATAKMPRRTRSEATLAAVEYGQHAATSAARHTLPRFRRLPLTAPKASESNPMASPAAAADEPPPNASTESAALLEPCADGDEC